MATPRSNKPATDREKPDSLLSLVSAGAQFVLMVTGIIGVATVTFGEGGVLAQLGDKLVAMESLSGLIAIPLVFIAIYVGRYWFERTFAKSSSAAIADAAMYTMMAVGAFYLFRLLTTGSFAG